jgi:hypothetical protein
MQFSLEFLNFCSTDFFNHPSLIRPEFFQAGVIEPFKHNEYDQFREKLKRLHNIVVDVFEKYPNRNAIAKSYVAKLLTHAYVHLQYPFKVFDLKVTKQAICEDLFSQQTLLLAHEIVEDAYFSEVVEIAALQKIKIITDTESEPELDFSLIKNDTVRADHASPPSFDGLSPFASARLSLSSMHELMNGGMHTPPGSPKSESAAGSDSDQEAALAPPPKDPEVSVQERRQNGRERCRFSFVAVPPATNPPLDSRRNSLSSEVPSAPPTRPTSSSSFSP